MNVLTDSSGTIDCRSWMTRTPLWFWSSYDFCRFSKFWILTLTEKWMFHLNSKVEFPKGEILRGRFLTLKVRGTSPGPTPKICANKVVIVPLISCLLKSEFVALNPLHTSYRLSVHMMLCVFMHQTYSSTTCCWPSSNSCWFFNKNRNMFNLKGMSFPALSSDFQCK